jgi:hypothetical protein
MNLQRYDGSFEHIYEGEIAGLSIQVPHLDINTVAAGGGSRLFFQSGLFVVCDPFILSFFFFCFHLKREREREIFLLKKSLIKSNDRGSQ